MAKERGTKKVREAAGKLPPLKGGRFLPTRRKDTTPAAPVKGASTSRLKPV